MGLINLNDDCISLGQAAADACDSVAATPALKLIHHVHQDASSARSHRMADGNGPAVRIGPLKKLAPLLLVLIGQYLCRYQRNRGKGFVDLDDLHVVDGEQCPLKGFSDDKTR